ncbi:MAG: hypothetical protein LBK41_06090 [Clostridiales bacterium]|nr:hypothetical protein [Clostridiales bacterium]
MPFSGEKPFMKLLAQSLKTRADGSIDEIFSGVCANLEKSDTTIIIDEYEWNSA